MKKKLWALMMAAAVTVSAVGCGNGKDPAKEAQTPGQENPAKDENSAADAAENAGAAALPPSPHSHRH